MLLELKATKVSRKEMGPNHEIITISPLPNGYGMTLGNALRRVLLTSLNGCAVTAVKIDGVRHEFSTIKGVKESVIDIILNLKLLRMKKFTKEPVRLTLEAKRSGAITAANIKTPSQVEIVNPELYIATLDSGGSLKMEIIVEDGLGYLPALSRDKGDLEQDMILIDALFSPIKKVRYSVDDTRVGQITDLNRLNIEIETDGSISPYDSLARSSRMLKNYFALFDFLPPDEEEESEEEVGAAEEEGSYTPVETLRLSPRTLNALINNNIGSIEQLEEYTERRLMNLKGFGKKAMSEIQEALASIGRTVKSGDEGEISISGGKEGADSVEKKSRKRAGAKKVVAKKKLVVAGKKTAKKSVSRKG